MENENPMVPAALYETQPHFKSDRGNDNRFEEEIVEGRRGVSTPLTLSPSARGVFHGTGVLTNRISGNDSSPLKERIAS